MAQPEKSQRFPQEIDAPAPHKVGHAKTIATPTGTLVKVRCKCGVEMWITKMSYDKPGRHAGRFCWGCGSKREIIETVS